MSEALAVGRAIGALIVGAGIGYRDDPPRARERTIVADDEGRASVSPDPLLAGSE